nr:hypothetical protein [Tanacetum cinerariifolium]
MSDSEDSTVTYITVSSPYERRSGDVSPGVDGPPVMPEDPYTYVVAVFQALPPPDYVPGPKEPEQAPPSLVYIPYVPKLVYPEYIPPKDDVFPAEEQPLPAAASPTAESPGYIPESDPDEDPEDDDEDLEEDLADYPADHDDEEEEDKEPSGDDADEEQDEDDDDEEEEDKEPSGDDADEEQDEDDDDEEEEYPASADSIPPPHALRVTAMISFRPQPLTLSFTKEDVERFLAMPIPLPSPLAPLSSPLPQIPSPPLPASPSILPILLPAASPPLQLLSSDRRADRPEVTLPPRKRLSIVHCPRYEAGESLVVAVARSIKGRKTDYGFVDSVEAEIRRRRTEDIGYGLYKMAPKKAAPKRTTRLNAGATSNPNQAPSTTITTVTNAQLQAMIDQGVNAALAARDANRTGDDSHTSGTGVRRTERVTRECTYQDFMKCQPLYFKGTEGVVELTQWFERMETELALLCVRTCPEESDRVERYIGGLPDSIYGSVAASKPKTMQEATEMATGLMDKKIK